MLNIQNFDKAILGKAIDCKCGSKWWIKSVREKDNYYLTKLVRIGLPVVNDITEIEFYLFKQFIDGAYKLINDKELPTSPILVGKGGLKTPDDFLNILRTKLEKF